MREMKCAALCGWAEGQLFIWIVKPKFTFSHSNGVLAGSRLQERSGSTIPT